MPKTIKEFQLNQSTGEVSVEYSDDSTSKFNAADMVTAQTDPVTGGIGIPTAAGYQLNSESINPFAALPNFYNAITGYNDATGGTLRIIGLGSSVGVGATLPDAATQAPVNKFAEYIQGALNSLSNATIAVTNGSVNGSTVTDGINTSYSAAKTTAGGSPNIVLLCYGMNDGAQGQYHSGQTYPGCATALINLINQIRGDGGDVVIATTPHPHSTRYPWAGYTTPISYPAANTQIPAPTYAASVVLGDWLGNGHPVPASYRHKRINELMRRVASDTGCLLIDVERYWFESVARFGEDALFDPGEYAHPNLLGHKASYWAAFSDFATLLKTGKQHAAVVGTKSQEVAAYKVNNAGYTTTSFVTDAQLQFYVGAGQVFEFEMDLFYTAPTAGDMKVGFSVPSGAGGRFGLIAPAYDATTYDTGPAIARSTTINGGWLQCGGNGSDCIARIRGVVVGGSASGYVIPQFAQVAASGTTTVYQYSVIKSKRIG